MDGFRHLTGGWMDGWVDACEPIALLLGAAAVGGGCPMRALPSRCAVASRAADSRAWWEANPTIHIRHARLLQGAEQRQSWTKEEDSIITASVLEFGHRWNRIRERLTKRTEHAIRNRWHRLQASRRDRERGRVTEREGGHNRAAVCVCESARARARGCVKGVRVCVVECECVW